MTFTLFRQLEYTNVYNSKQITEDNSTETSTLLKVKTKVLKPKFFSLAVKLSTVVTCNNYSVLLYVKVPMIKRNIYLSVIKYHQNWE